MSLVQDLTRTPSSAGRVRPRTVTIVGATPPGQQAPYLSITGTARIVEGGAPELLKELNPVLGDPNMKFPPDNAPPGFLTRIRIDKVGGIGPWVA